MVWYPLKIASLARDITLVNDKHAQAHTLLTFHLGGTAPAVGSLASAVDLLFIAATFVLTDAA